jgi:hypothetical protein
MQQFQRTVSPTVRLEIAALSGRILPTLMDISFYSRGGYQKMCLKSIASIFFQQLHSPVDYIEQWRIDYPTICICYLSGLRIDFSCRTTKSRLVVKQPYTLLCYLSYLGMYRSSTIALLSVIGNASQVRLNCRYVSLYREHARGSQFVNLCRKAFG